MKTEIKETAKFQIPQVRGQKGQNKAEAGSVLKSINSIEKNKIDVSLKPAYDVPAFLFGLIF
ncbi:MAG: hypothetical protein EHM58_00500 [Ignavibacteriae bacterium]|nr:MAG: hypothetical protein EHM58_00500 [Ignavibacteriota bacterium]